MLVAPNANGLLITPQGAIPSTFSQTDQAVGAYFVNPKVRKPEWTKGTDSRSKISGHATCTGYIRTVTHPIISRSKTTVSMNSTPIMNGFSRDDEKVINICTDNPEPVIGRFGVPDGVTMATDVGGNRFSSFGREVYSFLRESVRR